MDNVSKVEAEFVKRGVVPSGHVRIGGQSAKVTVGKQEPPPEPQVELIREGDVVKAIDVVCSCGQRIRLHCTY